MSHHSSNSFHFNKNDNVMSVEASDLARPMMRQIYADACDLGFTVISARTGREEDFRVCDETRDNENDLLYWTLEPVDRNLRNTGLKVVVFND